MTKQACDNLINIIHGKHYAPDPQRVHRNIPLPNSDRFRRVELMQLDPSVPVRDAQHRDG
ncbi:hypothetical protein hrd7_19820 [Leptolinea sp. HRD-7]|nr:hypothetical protein hrd7_19820 [Leptolinea sp. HRD-7]